MNDLIDTNGSRDKVANVLILFCSTSDRDNVYQILSYSDQRFMRYSFPNLIAPPSGESG